MIRTIAFAIGATVALGACSPPPKKPALPDSVSSQGSTQKPIDPRYQALPVPGPAPIWSPPSANKIRLENGLTVWHMPHGSAPLVSIHLVLSSGSSEDPKGKSGLTVLAADLLDEGAGRFSALDLSDKLGELATEYSSSGGVDAVLLSMNALAENLDESLALLADIVQKPKLLEQEFDRRKKHYIAAALTSRDDPRESRSKALAQALFGDGYASTSPTGTVDSLARISFVDARNRAKEITVPDGAHLTFAGAVDRAQVEEAAKRYFGDWKGTRKPTARVVEEEPRGGQAFVIDFPGAAQSSVAWARRAGGEGDPNAIAEDVMQDKIGGSFTGRINMNLREDKGYTYGAFSFFRRYQKTGYFAVVADVKTETTGPSVREVLNELGAVCGDRPLTKQERDAAVEGMLLGYPLEFDEVSAAGYRLAALPLKDRPVDYWTTWPEKVQRITTERANEVAQPFCQTDEYIVVVAGDQATVTPELEKLGLVVHPLNRDGEAIESTAPVKTPPLK